MGGPAPIPISEVLAYCQMFDISDVDDRAEFLDLIQRLDTMYLETRKGT